MARGGYRPSAGRPKGSTAVSPAVKTAEADLSAGPVSCDAEKSKKHESALAFAMSVINDPKADMPDKIRLAIAAMPFQHARLSELPVGKKEREQADANNAGAGTVWGTDLDADMPLN